MENIILTILIVLGILLFAITAVFFAIWIMDGFPSVSGIRAHYIKLKAPKILMADYISLLDSSEISKELFARKIRGMSLEDLQMIRNAVNYSLTEFSDEKEEFGESEKTDKKITLFREYLEAIGSELDYYYP